MEHIKIEQNSNVEVVDSNIIHKLAEEAQDCDASSNMTGNLQTTNAYEDDVDFLTAKFPGLSINVTNGMYIRFEDPSVLLALITNNISSDGQGVTTTDALAVTNLNSLGLTNNSSITSFTELRQFKNITYAPSGFFSGCTNLEWIALPENNTNLGIGFQISGGKTLKWVIPSIEFACSRSFNAWYQHPGRGGGSDHTWTFYDLNKQPITDVAIPAGVTTIGKYLFSKISCNSITFPSGIETIYNCAFENAQITQAFTPNLLSLITIMDNAFYNCAALTGNLELPSVTTLGNGIFGLCVNLTGVNLGGSSITYVPNGCFQRCTNLTSIELPSTCTTINNSAFLSCANLSTINLGNIVIFGNDCLSGCKKLPINTGNTSANITTIGPAAFADCELLTSLCFDNVTSIGQSAFINTGITSVDLSNTAIQSIPYQCFKRCASLTTVTLPSSCTELGNNSFENSSNLASINLSGITSLGNAALSTTHITGNLTLNLTSIGEGALYGTHLTSVDFSGSTFTVAEKNLFSMCVAELDHVIFPSTVTTVRENCFYNCQHLSYIVLPTTSTITWEANKQYFVGVPSTCIIYVDDSKVSEVTAALSGKFSGQIKGISEMPTT